MSLSSLSLCLSFLLLSRIILSSASDYSSKLDPKVGKSGSKQEHKTDGYGRKVTNEGDVHTLKSQKKETVSPYIIGVQGLIYCKVGRKLIPLKGALARITCLTVDDDGYESAPFSILSKPTDAKGYFSAKLSPYGVQSDKNAISKCNCKAFLEKSPWESCNIATNVNNGINGAPLSNSYRVIEKNVRLYSVGPFFYSPLSTSISYKY